MHKKHSFSNLCTCIHLSTTLPQTLSTNRPSLAFVPRFSRHTLPTVSCLHHHTGMAHTCSTMPCRAIFPISATQSYILHFTRVFYACVYVRLLFSKIKNYPHQYPHNTSPNIPYLASSPRSTMCITCHVLSHDANPCKGSPPACRGACVKRGRARFRGGRPLRGAQGLL